MATLGPIGFNGGLNTKASAYSLAKDQMSTSQNVHILYNDLFKVNGSSILNGSALNSGASVTGLCDWQTNAQARFLLAISGSKIYDSSNLSSTFTDITGSATITAGDNNQHTFASLNNVLAICGGTTPDTPLQWSGTGNVASLAGSPPTGRLVTTANNFMFISGIAATPSRIFWSNASDPGTWPAQSYIDFRNADGDIVTAIAPLAYNLAIFKRRSTGLLYTQTTTVSGIVTLAPLTQVNTYAGCAGGQAWDALPDGRLVVLGADAHLRYFDGSGFEDISDPPPPASNIQPNFDAVNIGRIPYAVVKVYPTLKQIWVAVSTGSHTQNDSIFVYNYELECWETIIPDRAANVMVSSIDTRTAPHHPMVLVSGDYGGYVYEQDYGTTNAQNSDGHIDGYGTISVLLGSASRGFNPKSLKVPIEAQNAGNLQIGWGYDGLTDISNTTIVSQIQNGAFLDSSFVLDQSMLAGPLTQIRTVDIASAGSCNTMQIQFRNQYASQPFTVHPFFIDEGILT